MREWEGLCEEGVVGGLTDCQDDVGGGGLIFVLGEKFLLPPNFVDQSRSNILN